MDLDFIARAAAFSKVSHSGQFRKYTGEPYWVHPEEVAQIFSTYIQDQDGVAACWLHDTIEDCGVTYEQLVAEFGKRTADLVLEVTDVSKPSDGNRKKRKAIDREHLATASPLGKSVKLADLISNTKTIVEFDPDFAKVYLEEKRLLMPILADGHPALFNLALAQL